ncbi:MAG: DUF4838 domain-containing protein [Candidatus Marinimicrobia bacterium]|nr:DUF4838 domain-containing protein [Candidatus Neomarinimicrobiota bacterium]
MPESRQPQPLITLLRGAAPTFLLLQLGQAASAFGQPANVEGVSAMLANGQPSAVQRHRATGVGEPIDHALVRAGVAAALIVLPADPSSAEQVAADDLRDIVRAATGVELPVKREDALPEEYEGTLLFIGRTQALEAAGLPGDPLEPEEYLIAAQGPAVFLAGDDSGANLQASPAWTLADRAGKRELPRWLPGDRAGGTHAAVVHFIENGLGGAFLWPGELGTVVPKASTLKATMAPVRWQPPLAQRIVRNLSFNSNRYLAKARVAGLEADAMLPRLEQSQRWFLDRGMAGGRLRVPGTHSTIDWWEKYGASEPELFAVQPSGVRGPVSAAKPFQFRTGRTVKQCTSNPRVVELLGEEMKKHFTENPEAEYFAVGINDGRIHGFCMCAECRALDNKAAESITHMFVDEDGQVVGVPYYFLTDRYAVFWRACHEKLQELAPGKKLCIRAYGVLEAPPVAETLPPGMAVDFVGPENMYFSESLRQAVLKRWDGWAGLGADLVFRPNIHYPGGGLPIGFSRKLDEDMKRFHRSGHLLGTDFDALHMSFGTQGHNHYVLARLVENPEVKYEEIMREFCSKAFGPAAAPMRAYFEILERATTETAADQETGEQWLVRYTRRLVGQDGERINALYEQARAAVPEDAPERARVEFFREGYRYAELVQTAIAATLAAARGQGTAAQAQADADRLQQWFDSHKDPDSWVVDRITIGDGILRRSWYALLADIQAEDTTLQRDL